MTAGVAAPVGPDGRIVPDEAVGEPGAPEPADAVEAQPAAPSRSPMRRSRSFDSRPTLTPDQRRRQARIVRLAMDTLGSADAIKSFLNDRHEGLGGRPLDLALASDEGLAAAEALIRPATGARD